MPQGYTCRCCGKFHDEIPMTYGAEAPVYVEAMSAEARANRVIMERSLCIVDNEYFFVRGSLIIPVLGSEEPFSWSVWSTISQANYEIMIDNWAVEGREKIVQPAFGYLSNSILLYGETLNLKLLIHTMPVGQIPIFELEPTDHPLSVEQREGITMERVHEIATLL